MTQQQMPSESERKAFIEKLGKFRESLPPSEQRMLDAMAIAAFQPQDQGGDVQGYWYYGYVQQPVAVQTPVFYRDFYARPWVGTQWSVAYQTVGPVFLP